MKKRALSFILTLSIIGSFVVVPLSAKAEYITDDEDRFTYGVMEGSNEATLAGFNGYLDYGEDLFLPSEINGYPVTKIEDGFFDYFPGIKNVYLPSQLKEIGRFVFSYGSEVEKVVIPATVEKIDEDAFFEAEALKEIVVSEDNEVYSSLNGVLFDKNKETLLCYPTHKQDQSYAVPEGVKLIYECAFWRTSNLEELVLTDSVREIGYSAFAYSKKLNSIYIPKNIIIPGDAFDGCLSIEDVYYAGSKKEWENDDGCDLPEEIIHFYCGKIEGWDGFVPAEGAKTFQFASGYGNKKGNDGNSIATYEYNDSYFSTTARENYNHNLAKMSLRLAMSAFAYHGKGDEKYTNQDKNARKLLTDIGFGGDNGKAIDSVGYKTEPSVNSIGAIAGHKKVTYGDKEYTLIALAIRGGNYESEWGGNFNVGTGVEHKGFSDARKKVVDFLSYYIYDKKISGDVKLWITGYSRAAAVTNLTAAYLNNNADEIGNITLTPDNIYAYCFETPAGTRVSDRNGDKYNNIYSIVNQNDFVPMVAPEEWGYGRYGTTYFLPSPRTNYDYDKLVGDMYTYYNRYAGNKYKPSKHPLIEDFDEYRLQWSYDDLDTDYGFSLEPQYSGKTLDVQLLETINTLTRVFNSPEEYSANLEEALVFVGDKIMGKGQTEMFTACLKLEIMRNFLAYTKSIDDIRAIDVDDVRQVFYNAVKNAFARVNVTVTDDAIDGLVMLLLVLFANRSLETYIGNLEILPMVHFPELCLAWMDSVVPSKFRASRKVIVNCPVNVNVYDSKGTLVANIYDGMSTEFTQNTLTAYIDNNGQKIIYLPADEEFSIEVTAMEDCEVTYSVLEENWETGEVKIINYNKMSVAADDVLNGTAENLTNTDNALYTLTSNDAEVSACEVIEDAKPVTVSVSTEGNGNVTGVGDFYTGEYAELSAIPFDGEYFMGWYDGEELLSEDYTYRFQVTEQTALTAKFSEDTCKVLYMTDNDEVVAYDRIMKGDSVYFPDMCHNPDYMIMGIYTDKECTIPAEEWEAYDTDTTLYVDVLKKDEWVQYDRESNMISVYTNEYMYDVDLITAVYEGGKLKELKPSIVELFEGKNEFDNPISDMTGVDMLKVFLWSSLSELNPLLNKGETELK